MDLKSKHWIWSAMLAFSLVVGCSTASKQAEPLLMGTSESQKSDRQVEIVFFSTNGDPTESFDYRFGDSLRKKFSNYKIRYIQSAKGSTLPELLTAGTKFDIIFHSIGNFEQAEQENNLQFDMDELVKKHNVDLSRLEPSIIEAIRHSSGGKLYGIPVNANNMVLYYNKSIFDKFGVSYPKDGMTWDQIHDLAKRLTVDDNGIQYLGFTTTLGHILRMNQLSIAAVDLKSETPTINKDDKWKTFFETIGQPFKLPGYPPNKLPDLNTFLKDQNVAMFAYLSSLIYVLPEDLKKLNWDIVSLPTFKDLPGVGSQSYPFYFGITKLSDHKDEAMQVLKYMISDEFQTELAQKGIMPVLKTESVQNELGKGSPFKDKNFKAVFHNRFAPIPPKAIYDASMVSIYAKHVDQAMKQATDLNSAFRNAEEEATKAIRDYKNK